MFKKHFQLGPGHKLSGSDRKKMKASIVKAFGCSQEVEEALNTLIPNKQGDFVEVCSICRVGTFNYYSNMNIEFE